MKSDKISLHHLQDIFNYKYDMNNIFNHSETAKFILLEGIELQLINYSSLNQLRKPVVVMVCPQLDKYVSVCMNQQGDSVPHVMCVLAVFLTVDVKTDDRAKMSVAAKMSLFKVGETRAHHISLATAAG